MSNIVLLIACLVAGILLRMTRQVPDNAHVTLNGFIINLALPALVLGQIHGLRPALGMVWPAIMPWLMFLLSIIAFISLAQMLTCSRSTTGALIMTAGLANTSFVGLPMIESFYGVKDVPTGIIIDQLGSYLALSTVGIAVACLFSAGEVQWGKVAWRVVRFPPLLALLMALALSPFPYPPWLSAALNRLGGTLAPLALVSVGLQLQLAMVSGNVVPLVSGLMFKLVLAPALLALLYVGILHQTGETTRVTIFEAAMGPQIGGAIVAMKYGLNPPLVTLMVGMGITLSFVTLPVWWRTLELF